MFQRKLAWRIYSDLLIAMAVWATSYFRVAVRSVAGSAKITQKLEFTSICLYRPTNAVDVANGA